MMSMSMSLIALDAVEGASHTTDLLIVGSNLFVVVSAMLLAWVTMKDVNKNSRESQKNMADIAKSESKNTRLIIRVLSKSDAKHRAGE